MAKKRKHNNPHKRGQRFFGRSRLWSWESELDADRTRIAYAEGRFGAGWVSIPPDVVRALVARPQNWIVCCRALCQQGDGDEWLETEIAEVRDLQLNNLEPIYADMRKGVLASVHPAHVIDVGWIAQTWRNASQTDSDRWYLAHTGQSAEIRRKAWLEAQTESQQGITA